MRGKIDPYMNANAGAMAPTEYVFAVLAEVRAALIWYRHAEGFVLDDAGGVDFGIGNYER